MLLSTSLCRWDTKAKQGKEIYPVHGWAQTWFSLVGLLSHQLVEDELGLVIVAPEVAMEELLLQNQLLPYTTGLSFITKLSYFREWIPVDAARKGYCRMTNSNLMLILALFPTIESLPWYHCYGRLWLLQWNMYLYGSLNGPYGLIHLNAWSLVCRLFRKD